MIKLVLFDVDGVLTNGQIIVDSNGNESKTINVKDLDAVFEMRRRGLLVGLITGEATPITLVFQRRFIPDFFRNGCHDKPAALAEILAATGLNAQEVCFVGDGKYDVSVMKLVGLAVCPSDAVSQVKALSGLKLAARGGEGCAWELLEWLISHAETNHNA